MKKRTQSLSVILLILIAALINHSFNNKNNLLSNIGDVSALKKIIVNEDYSQFVSNNQIFKKITPIPLETNDSCRIYQVRKVILAGEQIYIYESYIRQILIFDIEGRFLRRIGTSGILSGQYSSIDDFIVDNGKNIHLLVGGSKILTYSNEGERLNLIEIDIAINDIPLHPDQFIINDDGGFYFWKRYCATGPLEREQYSFYRVDKDFNTLDKKLPLERGLLGNMNRFIKFNDYYNICPPAGNDTIFMANEIGVQPNYYIDFKNKTLPKPVPEWEEYINQRPELEKEFVTEIRRFIEVDNWIYFRFYFNRYGHNAFYSKNDDTTYIWNPKREDPPLESIIWKLDGVYEGQLFAMIDNYILLEKLDSIKSNISQKKLSRPEKKLVSFLETVKKNDNPVIFICELK